MARNVVAMVSARGVAAVAGLVSLPVIFSRLGADDFGVWAVLSGLTAIVMMADLGLGSAVVRQVAASVRDGDPIPSELGPTRIVLGIALVWGVALAVLAAAVIMLVWSPLAALLHFGAAASAARWAAAALMLGVLFENIAMPWRGVLEGIQRYDVLGRINSLTSVLGAGLAVLVVCLGGGLVELAASMAFTGAVRAGWFAAAARRAMPAMVPSLAGASRHSLRTVWSYGLRVQVTSAAGAVNLEVDRFVLSGAFGPSVAGGFELGARLVNLCRLVPVLFLVTLFPMAVSRTAELGSEWLDRFNVSVTRVLGACAAIGAAGLVATAGPLVRLWLGQPNAAASRCIIVLAPAYAVNLVAGGCGILSRVEGRPGRETRYAIVATGLNVALTWPLLRLLGPVGVPLATAVGITVGTGYFLLSYYGATHRPIAPLARVIWPSLVAASVAAIAGLGMGWVLGEGAGRIGAGLAVLCRGSVVLLVGGAVLASTGIVDADEIANLRRLWRLASPARAAAVGRRT